MSELKPRQLNLIALPPRSIREVVADGFAQRQWKRDQKRLALNARKVAWAQKRRAAIQSAKAAERGKLPTTKTAGGIS